MVPLSEENEAGAQLVDFLAKGNQPLTARRCRWHAQCMDWVFAKREDFKTK